MTVKGLIYGLYEFVGLILFLTEMAALVGVIFFLVNHQEVFSW